MKTKIYNLLFAGLLSGFILSGCSKTNTVNELNNNPQHLENNNESAADDGTIKVGPYMLNRDLGIVYATDGKMNVTDQFSRYTFRLKGAQPTGELLVSNGQHDHMGTWNWRGGSDVLVMDFHDNTSDQLNYLHYRPWTVQPGSSTNSMKLAAPDGDQIVMEPK